MSACISFLLALARAIPAVENILRAVIAERAKDRERDAARRKNEKDAAVDAAIDQP